MQLSATATVWDLPTRLFHWLLLACVIGLFATAYAPGSWIDCACSVAGSR